MGAENRLREESGQSVLEFVLMLPMLIGITILMLRVNMAIQTSINNQQYARAQALFLAFNASDYPQRHGIPSINHPGFGARNRMVMGVSENKNESEEGDDQYQPEPQVQLIARSRGLAGSRTNGTPEPDRQGWVRIRNTVALCTPSQVMSSASGNALITSQTLQEGITPSAFKYCWSSQDE